MFVVRSELVESHSREWRAVFEPTSSLVLRALDEPETLVRFDTFATRGRARSSGGDPYVLLFGVMGTISVQPTYAVAIEWEVLHLADVAAFEDAQRQLFETRRQYLPSFVFDWLLKRLDRDGQYLALGVYGDEEGLRLGQNHPEIQRFAADHPPAAYAATTVGGARFFLVDSAVTAR
jgi:hypothetical protein